MDKEFQWSVYKCSSVYSQYSELGFVITFIHLNVFLTVHHELTIY